MRMRPLRSEGVYTARGWKIAAWTFGVLFILSWVLFAWLMSVGSEMAKNEERCAGVCMEHGIMYLYDDYSELCQCLDADSNVIHTEYMGDEK